MPTVVTPATSYDLTVLATVKSELGIANNSEDENLLRWIRQASDVVSKYCNCVFAKETVSETFRRATTRSDDILLSRYPVSSIVSVVENGVTLATTDYEVRAESGLLTKLSNDEPACWSAGKIEVVYVAGYALLTDLPYGIERACLVLVSQYRFSAGRDPQTRSDSVEGIGASSVFDGLDASGLSPEVLGLLKDHRKPAGS